MDKCCIINSIIKIKIKKSTMQDRLNTNSNQTKYIHIM
jgi:hypothetical protein